jgi:hypothetical protein
MAHDTHDSHDHAHGSDAKAAFTGLIVGAIILFGIVRTIVYLTNARYQGEKTPAEATK